MATPAAAPTPQLPSSPRGTTSAAHTEPHNTPHPPRPSATGVGLSRCYSVARKPAHAPWQLPSITARSECMRASAACGAPLVAWTTSVCRPLEPTSPSCGWSGGGESDAASPPDAYRHGRLLLVRRLPALCPPSPLPHREGAVVPLRKTGPSSGQLRRSVPGWDPPPAPPAVPSLLPPPPRPAGCRPSPPTPWW